MPRSVGETAPFPVEDLDAAKRWLWSFASAHEWLNDEPDDLPLVARLVCDVFWISPEALLYQLRRDWKRALCASPPARPRSRPRNGGR